MSERIIASRIWVSSRSVRSHSPSWSSATMASMIFVTIKRIFSGVGSAQAAGCRFAGIGDHHDGGFLELRFRTRIAKIVLGNLLVGPRLVLRFLEEIMQRPRAVMLRDKIDDPLRQAHFLCELHAVSHVADDDLCALRGLEPVVRVLAELVFDKVFRSGRFPDVVIKCADAGQQRVSADDSAGFFGKLADGVRMLIGSGSTQGKLAKDRQIGV